MLDLWYSYRLREKNQKFAIPRQVWLDGVGTGAELCTRPLVRLSSDLFLCDIAFPLNMGRVSSGVC